MTRLTPCLFLFLFAALPPAHAQNATPTSSSAAAAAQEKEGERIFALLTAQEKVTKHNYDRIAEMKKQIARAGAANDNSRVEDLKRNLALVEHGSTADLIMLQSLTKQWTMQVELQSRIVKQMGDQLKATAQKIK